MAVDAISYERLVEKALLCVVRDALEITRDNNALPGNHHFYISFKTKHDGVVLSERLLSAYPEDMTIVLQHEFSNLEVTPDAFSVTLSFSDVPERITVPFDAMTSFADPHARFAVSFNAGVASDPPEKPAKKTEKKHSASKPRASDGEDDGGNVVSLSAFRKKK